MSQFTRLKDYYVSLMKDTSVVEAINPHWAHLGASVSRRAMTVCEDLLARHD